MPHAYGLLRALRNTPDVHPDKIAVMGFSMGGRETLQAALNEHRKNMIGNEAPFAAHVAIYPPCGADYTGEMTGKPILMVNGTNDEYINIDKCRDVAREVNGRHPGLLQHKIYEGMQHRFDWWPSRGRSNPWWNEAAARDSRKNAVRFLRRAFGMRSRRR